MFTTLIDKIKSTPVEELTSELETYGFTIKEKPEKIKLKGEIIEC